MKNISMVIEVSKLKTQTENSIKKSRKLKQKLDKKKAEVEILQKQYTEECEKTEIFKKRLQKKLDKYYRGMISTD